MKSNADTMRHATSIDAAIVHFDTLLRTLHGKRTMSERPNPAMPLEESELSADDKKHSGGLMRVNHTGEVCAQALYQGQSLTAKLPHIRSQLQQAAIEEEDHLAWCQQRLDELHARPSILNPLWYGLSFGIGAAAGAISDKLSLGFVAATEDQVCQHLNNHLASLPQADAKSRAIIEQMHSDEAEHASFALKSGGLRFPAPAKRLMSQVAKVMTWASYRI